jgi:hypothetical protein
MCAFVVGTHFRVSAQRAYIEALQTMQDQSGIIFDFYIWRVIRSVGSLPGGALLLWLAIKMKGTTQVDINNPYQLFKSFYSLTGTHSHDTAPYPLTTH